MNRMGVSRCCCGCAIFEDDFDRADDTDIGNGWDEVSGDWEIDTNALRCDDAGARAIATKTYSGNIYLTTIISFSGSATARVIIDYVDSNNYHYAEINRGGSTTSIRLWKREGGTDSSISDPLSVDNNATNSVAICFANGIFSARLSTPLAVVGAYVSANVTLLGGDRAGLGVDDAVEVSFADFYLGKHKSADSKCQECARCGRCSGEENNATQFIQVTFTNLLGFAEPTFTAILPLFNVNQFFPGECVWRLQITDTEILDELIACDGDWYELTIQLNLAGIFGSFLEVIYRRPDNSGGDYVCNVTWLVSIESTVDCQFDRTLDDDDIWVAMACHLDICGEPVGETTAHLLSL